MKFLDVKTDYAFKKVFGSEQSHEILISFLNAVIHFNHDLKITSLEIVDPYNIPMIKGMKDSFVDVKARLEDNSLVIIEMQVLNHQGFEKRALYNAAKNYSVQLQKSEDYHPLTPVTALNIVDFIMFADNDKIISNFKLLEKEEFIHYSDDIELIFIELPKFKKTLEGLQTSRDKWIYFIKNAGHLDFIPEQIQPEIKQALNIANEANFSYEELELQHKRKEFIYIQKSSIDLAQEKGFEQGVEKGTKQGIEQGIEQGLKQGLKQGSLQAQTQIVISSYKAGLTVPLICTISGLNEAEVNTIISKSD